MPKANLLARPHYLKKNKANEMPSHVIAVDTETNINRGDDGNDLHTFRLGAYVYMRRNKQKWSKSVGSFFSTNDFWKVVDSYLTDKRTIYIIAHNMKYDYAILDGDEYLSSRGFTIKQFVIGQVFIISATRPNHQKIYFIDTRNWFSTNLRKLGKEFGLDKGEIENFENVSDEELLPYCINDTEIVALVFEKFIEFVKEHNLGNFSVTSAGQALNAYRHRFMKEKTILIHNKQELYEIEQKSYRGGRTDIFQQGIFYNVYKLDINSMYPFVMHDFKYPTKPISQDVITGCSVEYLLPYIKSDEYFVVADIDFSINMPAIAIKREKLIFPIGNIKGAVVTTPELQYILDNGKIVKINGAVIYEAEDIFSEYVDYFYKIKTEAKGSWKMLSKLFLNSLYGKFGQRKMGEISECEDLDAKTTFDIIDSDVYFNQSNGNKMMKLGDKIYAITPKLDIPTRDASPIISSAVTSYARMYLFKMFEVCGLDNLYYCDTDSIFTNIEGYKKLKDAGYIDETELGKLKLEGLGDCIIRNPKDYDWLDIGEEHTYSRTIKGVPKNAIFDETDNKYVYQQWVTGLTRYSGEKINGVRIKTVRKSLKRDYDKGTIDKNGKVHPLVFNEFS